MSFERFIAEVIWSAIAEKLDPEEALEIPAVHVFFEQLLCIRFEDMVGFDRILVATMQSQVSDADVVVMKCRLQPAANHIVLRINKEELDSHAIPASRISQIDSKDWN